MLRETLSHGLGKFTKAGFLDNALDKRILFGGILFVYLSISIIIIIFIFNCLALNNAQRNSFLRLQDLPRQGTG